MGSNQTLEQLAPHASLRQLHTLGQLPGAAPTRKQFYYKLGQVITVLRGSHIASLSIWGRPLLRLQPPQLPASSPG